MGKKRVNRGGKGGPQEKRKRPDGPAGEGTAAAGGEPNSGGGQGGKSLIALRP